MEKKSNTHTQKKRGIAKGIPATVCLSVCLSVCVPRRTSYSTVNLSTLSNNTDTQYELQAVVGLVH